MALAVSDATAWGNSTTASGAAATAFGLNTTANDDRATAWGLSTQADGAAATSWGANTVASRNNATAFGLRSEANDNETTAWGTDTRAGNGGGTVGGNNATAWGINTVAGGTASTAWGFACQATGTRATAWGRNTNATAVNSTAFGSNITVNGLNSVGISLGGGPHTLADANTMAIMGGEVGINTVSPGFDLDVDGDINYSGTLTNLSDARLKENLAPISGALAAIGQLTGYTYTWKEDAPDGRSHPEGTDMGVIAQEVEKLYPEAVRTDENGWKSVDYNRLTPVLIEAIKERSLAPKERPASKPGGA